MARSRPTRASAPGVSFFAGGLVRTDITASAAKELMSEIRNFPSHPPTAEELSAAKTASIQSLPGTFETTGATAGAVGSLFLYNRPLDYYAALPAMYSAVTSDDVARIHEGRSASGSARDCGGG